MRTLLSNTLKRKLIIFNLLLISVLSILITAESSDKSQNTIYGKIKEKADFLNVKEDYPVEKPFEKIFSFKNKFEEIISNLIFSSSKSVFESKKNIREFNKTEENKKFLAFKVSKIQTLNITEHMINSILFLVHRLVPIHLNIKNDTSNYLPLSIDTSSLSLIIPELSAKYNQNTNMTLSIYEDTVNCGVPLINLAIDGIYINFDIGLKMAVFNPDTQHYDEILDTIISTEVKATVYTQANKLNIFLMKVVVNDMNLKNNALNLEKDTLMMKFTGFLSLIIDQTRKMLTSIDVLKTLNDFSGLNFSSFEVITNVDYMIVTIQ